MACGAAALLALARRLGYATYREGEEEAAAHRPTGRRAAPPPRRDCGGADPCAGLAALTQLWLRAPRRPGAVGLHCVAPLGGATAATHAAEGALARRAQALRELDERLAAFLRRFLSRAAAPASSASE